MKERPILFSGAMVRAILSGAKTQTRRPVKPQPFEYDGAFSWKGQTWGALGSAASTTAERACPFGEPGDRLWVRETHGSADQYYQDHENDAPGVIAYRADNTAIQFDAPKPRPIPTYDIASWNWDMMKWKPSIHMPRWASRLSLEVTSIRVERLQDITEEGAEAEGFARRLHFLEAFEDIYGPGDPWVWVASFKKAA